MDVKNVEQKDWDSLPRPHTLVYDSLFLSSVVVVSLILYILEIGFYSDDWAYFGYLSTSNDQSLSGLYNVLASSDNIRSRPSQAFQQAFLYWLFGLNPLGYHVVNSAILLGGVLLFYLALRELNQQRLLALTIPLLYGLLPHYSTDRLWYSAFMVTLSMALYFLSLYADLRMVRARGMSIWSWKVVSLLGLVGSTLAYEVFLPLFLLNLLLTWYRAQHLRHSIPSGQFVWKHRVWLLGSTLLALTLVLIFKAETAARTGIGSTLSHARWFAMLIKRAFSVSYGDYGLGLPEVAFTLLRNYPSWALIVVGGVLSLIVFKYISWVARDWNPDKANRSRFIGLVILGFIVFGLGYAIFLTNRNAIITPTGIANRINLAAAVGIAITLIGAVGWVSTFLPYIKYRKQVVSGLITLFCASGFAVNNVIASFWIDSYRQQQDILADIRQQFPVLPPGSTLILDGICPYAGPAVVFESSWDLAGALTVMYGNTNLHADIVTPKLRIEGGGLASKLYGWIYSHYPYSDKLFVYHIGRKTVHPLPDQEAAHRYFQTTNPDFDNDCPRGKAGVGVPNF